MGLGFRFRTFRDTDLRNVICGFSQFLISKKNHTLSSGLRLGNFRDGSNLTTIYDFFDNLALNEK